MPTVIPGYEAPLRAEVSCCRLTIDRWRSHAGHANIPQAAASLHAGTGASGDAHSAGFERNLLKDMDE